MIYLFLGPPGSGKGTCADLLSEIEEIPHISTGDILREAIRKKTHLGDLAAKFINKGELVADDIMMGLLAERITRFDAHKGFILDGFPRTFEQAKKLDELLTILMRKVSFVFDLHLDDDIIVDRITSRRVCENCGQIFNIHNEEDIACIEDNTCRLCGGKIVQRPDDTEELVRKRIALYRKISQPVVEYYVDRPYYNVIDTCSGTEAGLKKINDIINGYEVYS